MKFKITFFTLMFYLTTIISEGHSLFIMIVPAILHELGHLISAKMLGIRIYAIEINVLGARITLDHYCSYSDEFIISLCGPLVNLVCSVVTLKFIHIFDSSSYLKLFFLSSSSLFLTNVLPIKSFDGGRMIECTLLKKLDPILTNKIISATSFITLFTLWCVSVYFMLRSASSLSTFIFSISLFANIFITKTI